ncbi:hypothetical protein [Aquipuribacter sp. MA13-6]|uniref:hypothetical protein n=1 Tax=unclassified Aquipuribacter TaxID=2635084 RepID=UPI003EEE91FA
MKVLFLALTHIRAAAIKRHSHFLLEHGVDVVLITGAREPWDAEGLDERVQVHTLEQGEARNPVLRVERLVIHAPRFLLGLLQRLLGRRSGPVDAVRARYDRLAQAFHRRVFMRGYRVLRPWLLWRVARRDVLPRLDVASFDEVVVGDSHAIPLGWHLARLHPDLKVGFSLDRAAYGDATDPGDPEVDTAADGSPGDVRVNASDL